MIDKPVADTEQAQVDAVKHRIRQILGELKTLAKSEVDDEQFLGQLGKSTLETTGAAGFTIWQLDDQQKVTILHESGTTSTRSNLDESQTRMHEKLVRSVNAGGRPTLIEPDARDASTGDIVNPMAFLLLLKPLQDPALGRQFVLELFQRPDIAAAARTGYMRYMEEIGEIFAAWKARHRLRDQSTLHGKQQRTMEFVRDIHASLEPREVAYAAANDGRVLAGADRLSVLTFDGRRASVLAVSGQDDFDNRSNVIRKLQNLATAVCRSGQPLWLTGPGHEELPRSIRELTDDYLNESHSRTLGVIPLFNQTEESLEDQPDSAASGETRSSVGAMIFEWFAQDVPLLATGTDIGNLTDHVGRALANARTHHSVFLLPVWKLVGKWKWLVQARTLPKTAAVAGGLLILMLFFFLFPWSLNMRVEGNLQPVEQQNVFANIDGVVSRVLVRHDQAVEKGQLLLELRNDELDYQLTSALGELDQINNDISTTRASSLAELPADQAAAADARLSALSQKRQTVLKQIGLLQKMSEKLRVYSPIDGTIVSWDPIRQLTERPVSREDVLLVVAAVDSSWQMELYIPERKYGHVLAAGEHPEVTFFAATDPHHEYQGKITEIEAHATEHEGHGSSVRAFASFDPADSPDLYVGAAVTAKIHCGTAPVGYCWFHELIEFVQSRVLF